MSNKHLNSIMTVLPATLNSTGYRSVAFANAMNKITTNIKTKIQILLP